MLSKSQRTAILQLHSRGVKEREIAQVLRVSRLAVRKVIRSASTKLAVLNRPEKAEGYRQRILELRGSCKRNPVRVNEELRAQSAGG